MNLLRKFQSCLYLFITLIRVTTMTLLWVKYIFSENNVDTSIKINQRENGFIIGHNWIQKGMISGSTMIILRVVFNWFA